MYQLRKENMYIQVKYNNLKLNKYSLHVKYKEIYCSHEERKSKLESGWQLVKKGSRK